MIWILIFNLSECRSQYDDKRMHATSTSPENDSHIKSGSLFEVSEEGNVVFVNRTQGHGVVGDNVGKTHVIKESIQCVATAYKDHMMGGHGPFVFVRHGTGVAGGEEMNITETIGGNYGKVHSNFTFEITPTFHGKLLEKYVGAMSGLSPDMVADRVSNFLGFVYVPGGHTHRHESQRQNQCR